MLPLVRHRRRVELAAVREASGSYDAGLLCVSALALFALLLAAKLKAEETPIKNTSG